MNYQRRNSRCILCFKPSCTSSNSSDFDSKFLLLLSRYLKIQPDSNPPGNKEKEEVLFCEYCSELGSSFCDLYFQLDCIRLQVNWKIRKIYETMLCAGRVSSRFNAFKEQFETSDDNDDERENVYTNIVQQRKNLMKHSKQTLRSSLPKIHLKRVCGGNIKMEQNSPNKASGVMDNSTPTPPTDNHQLLAALMSYIAVLHLSLPLHPSHIPNSFDNQYSTVIQDLELITEPETDDHDDDVEKMDCTSAKQPKPLQSVLDDLIDSAMDETIVAEQSLDQHEFPIKLVESQEIAEQSLEVEKEHHIDNEVGCSETITEFFPAKDHELRENSNSPSPSVESGVGLLEVEMENSEAIVPITDESLSDLAPKVEGNLAEEVQPPRKSLRSLLQCSKCSKTFTNQSTLTSHLKHHDEFEMDDESSAASSLEESSDVEMDILKLEQSDNEQEEQDDDADTQFSSDSDNLSSSSSDEDEGKEGNVKIKSEHKSKPVKKQCKRIPPNECEECHEVLSCEAAVEKHRVLKHKLHNYVRCRVCYHLLANHDSYVKHRSRNNPCFTKDPKELEPAAAPQFPYEKVIRGRLFCTHEDCYEVFRHEESRLLHLKTHGNWDCLLCPEKFSKVHEFAWHELTAHNTRSVKDPDVVKTLQRNRYKQRESDFGNIKFVCSRCPVACEYKRSIVAHFLHNHLDIPKLIPGATVKKQCKICKKVLGPNTSDKMMKIHLETHNVTGLDPEAIATCNICQAPFNKRINLTMHLKLQHKQTLTYECPYCKEQFKNYGRFKAHHKRKHKGESSGLPGAFQCEICHDRFSQKSTFERHKTIHNTEDDEGLLKCESCGKSFSNKRLLQNHVWYMHKPMAKTWHCDKCGKVFKTTSKLAQHTSYTHTDPSLWKFTCPEEGCGKKCWSKQKLTEHVRTHSKERPFVCDVCGESYRFRQYLRSHLAKMHGSSAAKTLPTQSYVKPFDQTVKRTEAEETDESSSSST